MMGSVVSRPVCHALAYLYPAYQTFKAVSSGKSEQHTQWLTFWIVNSCFSFVEVFGDSFLSWLPLFHEAKILFLVWLVAPQFRGATTIYSRVILPLLAQYERDIDVTVSHIRERSNQQFEDIRRTSLRRLRAKSAEILQYGQKIVFNQLLKGAEDTGMRQSSGDEPPVAEVD